MKLEGKVAIVTGGGAGIGKGIVHCLAEEGADVAVVDMNRDTARKVADEVKALGRKSLAIEADVTDSKQIARLVQETIDTFGKIDILVNNVGGYGKIQRARTKMGFINIEDAEWDESYELNFKSHVMMSRAVAPYFIKQKSGKIVDIVSGGGSGGGWLGGRVGAYGTMKTADIHFTKSLAVELAEHNINVNCISPGNVFTPLVERGISEKMKSDLKAKGMTHKEYFTKWAAANRAPLKRPQTPEDIGDAVVFLVSEDAKNITGVLLFVDGGTILRPLKKA